MVTVHLIANAHLDPVWLWRWPAGVIEALSTCRAVADLLERNSRATFTRSDQWLYEQIEHYDPDLFERIRTLVDRGQWHIVGGWYIQPDCNLPDAVSFRRHMELGASYFREKFGVKVDVGYNVDSFGHNAMIPSFLAEFGYDSYVMMRPMEHEMHLPGGLFRWQSPDGNEVMVWRIPRSYNLKKPEQFAGHIEAALDARHPEVDHVMCFFGIGDHGGGPSLDHIRWIETHEDSFDDARLIFSHPRAFFDAVKPQREILPVVHEELQQEAIGSYSVVHEIKSGSRRAEHALGKAGICVDRYPQFSSGDASGKLEAAWKKVLFNQFHDILAGTSIADAYRDCRDQLGHSCAVADSVTHATLFKRLVALEWDKHQRIVAFNLSDHPYAGPIEYEPWLDWTAFRGQLVANDGTQIPYQAAQQPAIVHGKRMLVWFDELGPGEEKVYRLIDDEPDGRLPADSLPSDLRVADDSIENKFWRILSGSGGSLFKISHVDGSPLSTEPDPHVTVLNDYSDTWSHDFSSFPDDRAGLFEVQRCEIEEKGPVRATLRVDAAYGRSLTTIHVHLYAGSPIIDIRLHLQWAEKLKLAKFVFPFAEDLKERIDGIPGGELRRLQNGREYPLTDWTSTPAGTVIACPDCFSLDGRENHIRFTLVRSPVYAWHDPAKLEDDAYYRYTDQGEHFFTFRLLPNAREERARQTAMALHRPPICLDWTAGM